MQYSFDKPFRSLVAVGFGLWVGSAGGSKSVIGQEAPEVSAMRSVVFEEDFSQGPGRWETTDEGSWEIFHKDGNPTFGLNKRVSDYQPKVRSPHNIALIKGVSVGDVSITFRVRSTLDTGNHRDCCVFFGYQDPEHFYYVHLGAKPDPASGQIMIVNGQPRRPLTENKNAVPWDDSWHRVKLVRRLESGLIQVYFDDMERPLMQATDKTFGVGRLGIGSFDDQNEFDDLQVTSLDPLPKAKVQEKPKKAPERPEPTVSHYVYGRHSPTQRWDFLQAAADRPKPVAAFITGGGC